MSPDSHGQRSKGCVQVPLGPFAEAAAHLVEREGRNAGAEEKGGKWRVFRLSSLVPLTKLYFAVRKVRLRV